MALPSFPLLIVISAFLGPRITSYNVCYTKLLRNNWTVVAKYEALADASNDTLPAIPDENFSTFGESSAVGMNTSSMDSYMKDLFGDNYSDRFGNGVYSRNNFV